MDSQDARWSSLRVWRDLNQDGVSQSGELFTLGSLGIAALNVAATEHTRILPNGNQVADLGTYVRSDGSTGTLGETSQMADVNLADDTFHRQFTDTVPLTPEAQNLPDMQGSGLVRDLREAASQSSTLANLLAQYAAAPTRAAQLALIDQLLDAWADTTSLAERMEERTAQYRFRYMGFGAVRRSDHVTLVDGSGSPYGDNYATHVTLGEDLSLTNRLDESYRDLIAHWNQRIHILEAFNGRYFFSLPEQTQTGQSAIEGLTVRSGENYYEMNGGVGTLLISYSQGQLDLLNQSYEALRESVYSALIVQTRFASLLDQIQLVIDENGIRFDFAAVTQAFQDRVATNAAQGMSDLIEFNRHAGNMLRGMGWEGLAMMEGYMRTLPIGAELQAVYDEFHVSVEGMTGFTGIGSKADEIIVAGAGVNNLHGGDGDDTILGGADNDNVFGNNGNDLLDGGTGNDYLEGGAGSDTYIFNRGSGQDAISNNDTSTGKTDTLEFGADILPSDIVMTRSSTNLLLNIAGTTDTVTVRYFFDNDGNSSYGLEQVRFADGTIWSKAAIKLMAIAGNDTAQTLTGYATADVINALGGNDVISGGGGNDTIDGGDGADTLYGDNGNDTIFGGAGNDTVYAGNGNDVLDGGTGSDVLVGGAGNDTYWLARGYGNDTIQENDATAGNTDLARFDTGIAVDQLWFRHVGNNLEVSIIGTADRFTLQNWYSGSACHVEQFRTADGRLLLDTQVENLVQAMAAFSPPASGQTTLPQNYQDALSPVIAANWQ